METDTNYFPAFQANLLNESPILAITVWKIDEKRYLALFLTLLYVRLRVTDIRVFRFVPKSSPKLRKTPEREHV